MARYLPLISGATVFILVAFSALAQQPRGGWQTETAVPPSLPPSLTTPQRAEPAREPALPNTTVVPRSPAEPKPAPQASGGQGQLSLTAVLTEDGQGIEQGLVWRVFRDRTSPDSRPRLVSTHREASPTLRLEAGMYIINVAFGRAHLTRKITVSGDRPTAERFVLNAGGLRLSAVLANGQPAVERSVTYDIYSDERDQYGQRTKVASGLRPGLIVRLNAGIYSIVSTYGDTNATARADVTVEAGKLTEATLSHAAAKVTFKLVTQPGGDAIADTQWNIATTDGEQIKESSGALPTHILAPGTYTVSARHAGHQFQREFTVRAGDTAQVEVEMR